MVTNSQLKIKYLILGTITAIQDAWLVGDNFLREMYSTFTDKRTLATINRHRPPYLYEFYNVFGYFQNKQIMLTGVIRIFNSLVEGLNARIKLPKYVILIIDRHMIKQTAVLDPTDRYVYDTYLKFLIKHMENYCKRKEMSRSDKKPGSVLSGNPKFVWVKMLKRPDSSDADTTAQMRG